MVFDSHQRSKKFVFTFIHILIAVITTSNPHDSRHHQEMMKHPACTGRGTRCERCSLGCYVRGGIKSLRLRSGFSRLAVRARSPFVFSSLSSLGLVPSYDQSSLLSQSNLPLSSCLSKLPSSSWPSSFS
ncbi:hypothetical protein BDM02DRAFT_2984512 [Thelephora ganbajun]|uniref:Uncharacterized protein n=1 Tax=Thelephora ganbajun TaxID=370292 RepID=A0ACB6ZAW1_THEGA|nr:hypothetical protein BDM02DRAFT_2984512 [Thelephora ganbajun]